MTPFPGTPLYHRLHREGRLLQDRYWDACTLFDVTYRPQRMSVEELESGLRWLFTEAYSPKETGRRRRGFAVQASRQQRFKPVFADAEGFLEGGDLAECVR